MSPEMELQIRDAITHVRVAIADDRFATPAEAAEMLDRELPAGVAGVPGGLRYAIARAQQQVLAPPFASLDEFSCTIARFQLAGDIAPPTPAPVVIEPQPARSRRLEWFAAVAALLCGAFAVGAVAPALIGHIPFDTPAPPQVPAPMPLTASSPPPQRPVQPSDQHSVERHTVEQPAVAATKGTADSSVERATDDAGVPEGVEPPAAVSRTSSRDGARIADLRAEADDPDVWNLWLQPGDGGEATRLTQYTSGRTGKPSWFPDNHRICYTHDTTIVVLDVYGGSPRTFESPVKGRAVAMPAVSPDGSKVIFQVSQSGAWMLDVAEGTMDQVLADPTAEDFAWAPDGRRVAFRSRREGQLATYVLTRD